VTVDDILPTILWSGFFCMSIFCIGTVCEFLNGYYDG
jgi:hypothetical protein